MAAFEQMARSGQWPYRMLPAHLTGRQLAPMGMYRQDFTGTDTINRKLASEENFTNAIKNHQNPTQRKEEDLESALLWFKSAYEHKLALPYVVALLGGLIVLPYFTGSPSVYEATAVGYALGGATYYLEIAEKPVVNNELDS
jgi:hypothetical protein